MSAKLSQALALSTALLIATLASARADDGLLFDVQKPARVARPGSVVETAQPMTLKQAVTPSAQGSNLVVQSPDGETIVGPPLEPDEAALRYYVSLNQKDRVATEIARLRAFYPGWEPPTDLYDPPVPAGPDEGALWDLFGADKMTELAAEIARRKVAEPGWEPSPDLQQKIKRKIARIKIMNFWKQGRWQDVVDYMRGTDGDVEADVDVLWTVAEAYARTKQIADAQRVYEGILRSDKDPGERLATIQKAMGAMRMADVEPIIALMNDHRPDGSSELAPIMVDIARARISAFLHDERQDEVADNELQLFEDYARTAQDANQPGLVAWYAYKRKRYQDALDWFKFALERGGDAMIAHGLAHSLRKLDMKRETEEVAYAWREPLVNNAIVFLDILENDLTREIPPFIEEDRLARYGQVTLDLASGEGAQALAWYAYNSCQFDVALAWFQRAVAWLPKEATAYGYALTLRRLKKKKEFTDVVNRYDGLFPKVLEILFPDNYYHPPTICDAKTAPRVAASGRFVGAGVPVPAPSGIKPEDVAALREADLRRGFGPGSIVRPDVMPKIDKADFPVAVDPQNDLRYAAIARPSGQPPAMTLPASADSPLLREARGTWPLVARRVPGVGAMPYERYGFLLLPSYDGRTDPSTPHSAQAAPAGTLWATEAEQAGRSVGFSSADAMSYGGPPAAGLPAGYGARMGVPAPPPYAPAPPSAAANRYAPPGLGPTAANGAWPQAAPRSAWTTPQDFNRSR